MVTTTRSQQFDVIVIGSGIGGLTVAALLSKLDRKSFLVLNTFTIFLERLHRAGFSPCQP